MDNKKWITLKCDNCRKFFDREERFHRFSLKSYPDKKSFCSSFCSKEFNKLKFIELECLFCKKQFQNSEASCNRRLKNNLDSGIFCSSSCSARQNNKIRKESGFTTAGKSKIKICGKCNIEKLCSLHASFCKECVIKTKENAKAKACSPNGKEADKIRKTKRDLERFLSGKAICHHDGCLNAVHKSGASVCATCKANKTARSLNEIGFGKLCSERWECNFNRPMFGETKWDADIIIPELKIAILWNGIWHYKDLGFCIKNTSLSQTQNRDRLKIKAIIEAGWTPYLIQDLGRFNQEKVNYEFGAFLSYLKDPSFKEMCREFAETMPHSNFHNEVDER
jgi:hypothetical protein